MKLLAYFFVLGAPLVEGFAGGGNQPSFVTVSESLGHNYVLQLHLLSNTVRRNPSSARRKTSTTTPVDALRSSTMGLSLFAHLIILPQTSI